VPISLEILLRNCLFHRLSDKYTPRKKMKNIISLVLVAIIAFLAYALFVNIKEPIEFQDVKKARKTKVVDRLKDIRQAQEIYRLVTGEFAGNFDTLSQVIRNDSIKIVTIFGDKDNLNSTEEFREVITYKSAIDSLMSKAPKMNLDSLRYIPFTDGGKFSISADTMTYQSTLVSVVEVGTRWKNFMGKYASKKYSKYDNSYDPDKMLKFGDMGAPNLAGNWER